MTDAAGQQPESYFERLDTNLFRPTEHVVGAWNVEEQHISPMNGLVVHEVERLVRSQAPEGDAKVIGRIGIDILGVLPMAEFELHLDVVRPGRTIELLEATVIAGGRPAVRTRLWRLATYDTASVVGGAPDPMPRPENIARKHMEDEWPGGFVCTVDLRPIEPVVPGRARAWMSTPIDLVAGEQASDLARFVGLLDTANGIAIREPLDDWMYPNVDMTVHFHRQPVGRTVGFDTTVIFGPAGQGLTTTVLHDVEGPVGMAQQLLTVRER